MSGVADGEWLIRVDGGRDELVSLLDWLTHDDALRGRARLARPRPDAERMGDLVEVLTVAVGSGGVGSALASSLTAWLIHRRSDIKLTLQRHGPDVSVELDAARVKSPELLTELRALLDPPGAPQ